MEPRQLAEFAFDIQTGLGRIDIPDFDFLRTVGMSSTLAVHIRGLGEIDYELLRKVSDFYFDIPSFALKDVLNILAEVEFIDLIKINTRIHSIIPKVPHFKDIYSAIGSYVEASDLNEHENAILAILGELYDKPENRDRLIHKTGIDNQVLDRCITIGESGGFIRQHRARGKSILVSPYYFADNIDTLVDVAAKAGSSEIQKVLKIVKNNQGWPMSLLDASGEVGGCKLSETQHDLLTKLASEGVMKPPIIEFAGRRETFLFTPHPGKSRLNATNREIYERAMALVSSVRKGQLLPDKYRIRMPVAILTALRDRGYLRSSSEAIIQYHSLVVMKVGYLRPAGNGMHQFHLHDVEENRAALDLAISLLQTGELTNLEVNQDARIALAKDERYIQSIVAATELRKREKQCLNEEAKHEFDQLLLQFT